MGKRVFIGPQEIAGYYSNLKKGFDALGISADLIEYRKHKSGYNDLNTSPSLVKLIQRLSTFKASSSMMRKLVVLVNEFLKGVFLISSLFTYHVYVFGYGESILRNNQDLKILKLFRKKIIFNMAHGSEMRVPAMDGFIFGPSHIEQEKKILELIRLSKRRKNRSAYIEKYADIIIGAPFSSALYAEKKFINLFNMGLPIDFGQVDNSTKISHTSKVRILHCPSNPKAKGTEIIREVIKKIKQKGIDFEYVEIIGQPNSKVLEEIEKCSFVVDQIYSDLLLAGLGTEAAWYGKATVVAGYGLKQLKSMLDNELIPPSEFCAPDEIQNSIEKLINDTEYCKELGEKAQQFVHNNWHSTKVAKKYLDLIEGKYPENWEFDPYNMKYIWGCGIKDSEVISNLKGQIKYAGKESLMFGHRSDIEEMILEHIE